MTVPPNGNESPFDTTPDAPSSEPKYSPISVSALHAAVGQRGLPPEYLPLSVRALDELQLALLAEYNGNFLTRQLTEQADRSKYLNVQRYSPSNSDADESVGSELDAVDDVDVGNPSADRGPTHFDDILFLSGPYVRTLLEESLGYAVPEFVGPVDRFTHTPWAEPSHPPEEDIRIEFVPAGSKPTPEEELIAGIDTYPVRDELVRVVIDAFAIYSSEPGFMDAIGSVSGPSLAVRTAPHDELVMEEPGPYSAPIPGAVRHR
ncbi:hypothetical protein [Halonotius pteroides]|uniref:Uncharacterized protein n=1 Tax=Halonotius pteroides TaxID=268735 RepID=A0A3A6QFH2_9EURY|nr:hypothetical protein [Halonotius pteroides]RJX50584.1 hypothetical protein DP106_04780 [Halonotius pteroides]